MARQRCPRECRSCGVLMTLEESLELEQDVLVQGQRCLCCELRFLAWLDGEDCAADEYRPRINGAYNDE
jgi:hypothetical protein